MTYGEVWQTYGSGTCPRCGVAHMPFIRETTRSRFELQRLILQTMNLDQQADEPLSITPPGAGQSYMLGVLVSGNNVIVSASGNNNNNPRLIGAIAALNAQQTSNMRYTLAAAITGFAGHQSRVLRAIPDTEYAATRVNGASAPGNCAAPRLIKHAIGQTALRTNWQNWELSEVFSQPNTAGRTLKDEKTLGGIICRAVTSVAPQVVIRPADMTAALGVVNGRQNFNPGNIPAIATAIANALAASQGVPNVLLLTTAVSNAGQALQAAPIADAIADAIDTADRNAIGDGGATLPGNEWMHGLSAPHCATCNQLVPLLMCPIP